MVIPFITIGYNGPTLEVETLERELQVKSAQAEEAKWIVPVGCPVVKVQYKCRYNIHSKKNQG